MVSFFSFEPFGFLFFSEPFGFLFLSQNLISFLIQASKILLNKLAIIIAAPLIRSLIRILNRRHISKPRLSVVNLFFKRL